MKIRDTFQNKTVLSFEIFPPKRTDPVDTVYKTLDELKDLRPDFISVTYGAGGGSNNSKTVEIAAAVKNVYHVESVAHLTCLYLSRREVLDMMAKLRENNIDNIMALRGDLVEGMEPKGDFSHANEMIEFIRENGDFNIFAACYPEGHPGCPDKVQDIRNLRKKVEAGADSLISQLFLDNDDFHSFREKTALAGIDVPIEAGIMPVTNKKQIERMSSLCGAKLPKKFVTMMQRYEHNPIAMRDAGIAYAINQIVDLLAQDVDGIHLYTMNNPYVARKIYEAVHRLFEA